MFLNYGVTDGSHVFITSTYECDVTQSNTMMVCYCKKSLKKDQRFRGVTKLLKFKDVTCIVKCLCCFWGRKSSPGFALTHFSCLCLCQSCFHLFYSTTALVLGLNFCYVSEFKFFCRIRWRMVFVNNNNP